MLIAMMCMMLVFVIAYLAGVKPDTEASRAALKACMNDSVCRLENFT